MNLLVNLDIPLAISLLLPEQLPSTTCADQSNVWSPAQSESLQQSVMLLEIAHIRPLTEIYPLTEIAHIRPLTQVVHIRPLTEIVHIRPLTQHNITDNTKAHFVSSTEINQPTYT
ncbi:hypothetical protein EMCRGX_G023025 [Ephydatia muelleri]